MAGALLDTVLADLGDNPGLTTTLGVIGALAVAGFVWGVTKAAFKAALFFAVVGAAAWLWFAQQAAG